MDCRLVSFGRIEIDRRRYDHDVVVARPTAEACELLAAANVGSVAAINHVTC